MLGYWYDQKERWEVVVIGAKIITSISLMFLNGPVPTIGLHLSTVGN
jgi:hypothetical protein